MMRDDPPPFLTDSLLDSLGLQIGERLGERRLCGEEVPVPRTGPVLDVLLDVGDVLVSRVVRHDREPAMFGRDGRMRGIRSGHPCPYTDSGIQALNIPLEFRLGLFVHEGPQDGHPLAEQLILRLRLLHGRLVDHLKDES